MGGGDAAKDLCGDKALKCPPSFGFAQDKSAAMHHTVHGAAQPQANMRLDSYLSEARLIKRRTQAKKACEEGVVLLDGKVAKPGKEVKVGQIVSIYFVNRTLEVQVLGIPSGNVRKEEAKNFYKIIREEKRKKELF